MSEKDKTIFIEKDLLSTDRNRPKHKKYYEELYLKEHLDTILENTIGNPELVGTNLNFTQVDGDIITIDLSTLGGGSGENFATADLTFTEDRIHDLDEYTLDMLRNTQGFFMGDGFIPQLIPNGLPYIGIYDLDDNADLYIMSGIREIFGQKDLTSAMINPSTGEESSVGVSSTQAILQKKDGISKTNQVIVVNDEVRLERFDSNNISRQFILNEQGYKITVLPMYADDAAAGAGGLVVEQLYQTDGTGAAPLNVAGILMIKQ